MRTSTTASSNDETFPRHWHTLAALRIYSELANAFPDARDLYRTLTTDEDRIISGREDFRALPEALQPVILAEIVQYAARAAAAEGPTGTYAMVQFQAPVSVSYFAQHDHRLLEAHQNSLGTAIRSAGLDGEPSMRDPVQDTYQRAGVMFPALWTAVFLPVVNFEALVHKIGVAYLMALREAVERLGYPTLDTGGAMFEIPPTHDAAPEDVAV